MEVTLAPCGLSMGIHIETCGHLRLAAGTVVHRQLAGAAQHTGIAAQVELAGRVVAGMASHALGSEDRLYIALVRQAFSTDKTTYSQQQPCKNGVTLHGTAPEKQPAW